MNTPRSRSSVVVGIDGSAVAVEAASWAAEESADRDVPLRLVYVIDEGSSDMSIKLQYAETALRAATRAAEAAGRPVGIETSIVYGSVDDALDRRMEQWRNRYPGVPVHVVCARGGFGDFLAYRGEPVALAVIPADGHKAADLLGPVGGGIVHHARCSVLVVPAAAEHRTATRMNSASSIVL